MKEFLAMAVLACIVVVIPTLYVWSHLSICGWKGLFVECRIMDCPKP